MQLTRIKDCTRPLVTFFTRDMYRGGAEVSTLELAREFSKFARVHIVLLRSSGPLLEKVPDDIEVHELGVNEIHQGIRPLSLYLKKHKPQHFISGMSLYNIVSVLAKIRVFSCTKLTLVEHSNPTRRGAKSFKKISKITLIFFLYRFSENIVAVSSGVASDLAQIVGNRVKINVIYPPLNIASIINDSRIPQTDPWLIDFKGAPIIAAAGRMSEVKDFASLIKAFSIVLKRMPARLLLLGNGSQKKNLLSLASKLGVTKSIHMPGMVSNPYNYLSHADLFVVSSSVEGFGRTLPEAMSLGVPVISTDCPSGPFEILDGGKYGDLVEPGDVVGMAEAIIRVLTMDKDALSRRLESARKRAMMFDSERVSVKYRSLLGI